MNDNIAKMTARDSGYTIAPVNAALAISGADSEWMRLPSPRTRLWGLSRTTWVELLDSGTVQGITLRKRHAKRGIRLIHRPSAEAYLRGLMEPVSGENGKTELTK